MIASLLNSISVKKNKVTDVATEPVQNQENNTASVENDGMLSNGLWMEFEDSFIQLLSGFEPIRTYYNNADIQQQQISC